MSHFLFTCALAFGLFLVLCTSQLLSFVRSWFFLCLSVLRSFFSVGVGCVSVHGLQLHMFNFPMFLTLVFVCVFACIPSQVGSPFVDAWLCFYFCLLTFFCRYSGFCPSFFQSAFNREALLLYVWPTLGFANHPSRYKKSIAHIDINSHAWICSLRMQQNHQTHTPVLSTIAYQERGCKHWVNTHVKLRARCSSSSRICDPWECWVVYTHTYTHSSHNYTFSVFVQERLILLSHSQQEFVFQNFYSLSVFAICLYVTWYICAGHGGCIAINIEPQMLSRQEGRQWHSVHPLALLPSLSTHFVKWWLLVGGSAGAAEEE